jgi:hypothetical protein
MKISQKIPLINIPINLALSKANNVELSPLPDLKALKKTCKKQMSIFFIVSEK